MTIVNYHNLAVSNHKKSICKCILYFIYTHIDLKSITLGAYAQKPCNSCLKLKCVWHTWIETKKKKHVHPLTYLYAAYLCKGLCRYGPCTMNIMMYVTTLLWINACYFIYSNLKLSNPVCLETYQNHQTQEIHHKFQLDLITFMPNFGNAWEVS